MSFFVLSASGKKFPVLSKRLPGAVVNKSQTLPRSMGRSQPVLPCHRPSLIKPSLTPPSVKRQFSVPGSESPLRRRPTTTNSNSGGVGSGGGGVTSGSKAGGTPVRKLSQIKGVEPKLAQVILDEILEGGAPVLWDDIAGQEVVNYYLL